MNRIISFFTAFSLLFCIGFATYTVHADGTTSDGFIYTVNAENTAVTITGYTGSQTDIIIPSTIEDISVTTLADNAFSGNTAITSVSISSTLRSIGKFCFYNNSALKTVTISNGTKIIDTGAFSGCSVLSQISIPGTVTTVSEAAFEKCSSLFKISFAYGVKTIEADAFRDCTMLYVVDDTPSISSVGLGAFSNTLWLNNRPQGIVYIGSVAYDYVGSAPANGFVSIKIGTVSMTQQLCYGLNGLTTVTIPPSITEISTSAFANCPDLTYIRMYYNLKTISDYAFYNCSSIVLLYIPTSVTSISANAFSGATNVAMRAYNNDYVKNYCTTSSIGFRQLSQEIIVGDVNDDSKIDSKDSLSFLRYLAGWDIQINANNSDTCIDSRIDGKDLLRLKMYLSSNIDIM